MSKGVRYVVALAVGLLVWVLVATMVNFVLRAAIPDYRAEEVAMSFSLIAQLSRLVLGLVSTAAATATTAVLSRGSIGACLTLGCILLALFVPVHISLWQKFPVWYHVFFLASLPLGAYVVGRLVGSKRGAA
jgi:hypothetical protein